jgi:hypothetical protein
MESINSTTEILIKSITDDFIAKLKQQVAKQVSEHINLKLSQLDVPTLVREHLSSVLSSSAKTYNFPHRSIHGSSINPDGLFIKADQIAAGTVRNFESTGIQDKATETQVTILDNATVFENKLVAKNLHIAGSATVEGDLNITGTIPSDSQLFRDVAKSSVEAIHGELKKGMLSEFKSQVLEDLQINGIDPGVIRYQGQKLVKDNALAPTVIYSNLQKVGALKELQVIGETLLDETLYISNNRMGINTMEPEAAFDLWDQEIEVQIGKLSKDYAYIGSPKPQAIVLTSNKHENLILNVDGSITVSSIRIGGTRQTSSDIAPTDAAPKGQIVWNSNPKIDDPIGWVSLGNARWANFGVIKS